MNLKTLGIIPYKRQMCLCDFHGYVVPEMVKIRHCVVVSSKLMNSWGTVIVVPISSVAPKTKSRVYVELDENAYSCMNAGQKHWAKCHMLAHVGLSRLDRLLDNGQRCLPLLTESDFERVLDGVGFAVGIHS